MCVCILEISAGGYGGCLPAWLLCRGNGGSLSCAHRAQSTGDTDSLLTTASSHEHTHTVHKQQIYWGEKQHAVCLRASVSVRKLLEVCLLAPMFLRTLMTTFLMNHVLAQMKVRGILPLKKLDHNLYVQWMVEQMKQNKLVCNITIYSFSHFILDRWIGKKWCCCMCESVCNT